MKTASLVTVLLLLGGAASAQTTLKPDARSPETAADARWQPWLGCWQMVGRPDGAQVCVAPAAQPQGVTLKTMADGRVLLEQTIVATGTEQPIAEASCRGAQTASWSRTGRRLITRGELRCGDDQRHVSGISFITAGNTWIDVQVVEVAGRDNVRVRRYQPVTEPARTRASAGAFTIDEVKELSAGLPPQAIEAALSESKASFDLSGRKLIELDDAKVPDRVIDLMVALSYPDRFVVDRRSRPEAFSSGGLGGYGPVGLDAEWESNYPYFWPYAYGGYLPGSMLYDYSPLGYSYWYGPAGWLIPGGGVVIGGPVGGIGDAPAAASGRAVEGRGYTRVRPREAESGAGGSQQAGSRTSSSAPDSGSSSGSTGSAGATSEGYSGGGGGGSGRTAQPR